MPAITETMRRTLSELRRELKEHATYDSAASGVVVDTHLDDLATLLCQFREAEPLSVKPQSRDTEMLMLDASVSCAVGAVNRYLEEEQQNVDPEARKVMTDTVALVEALYEMLTRE